MWPVAAQITMMMIAMTKAQALPKTSEVPRAKTRKESLTRQRKSRSSFFSWFVLFVLVSMMLVIRLCEEIRAYALNTSTARACAAFIQTWARAR
jgi:hypothetical protein